MFKFNLAHDDIPQSKLLFILTIWSFLSLSTDLFHLHPDPAVQAVKNHLACLHHPYGYQFCFYPSCRFVHRLAYVCRMLGVRFAAEVYYRHNSLLIPLSLAKLAPKAKGGTVNGWESHTATPFRDLL